MTFRGNPAVKAVLIGVAACVFTLSGTSVSYADDPVELASGDHWTVGETLSGATKTGVEREGAVTPQAGGWAWVCRGTFASPDLSSVGGFSWGAYQQCTSPVAQQVSVRVNLCVQDPGGPSQFHCDVTKGYRKGALVTSAYQTRTNATISGCSRSKTSKYVQVAYSIMANYEYYPTPVTSNQTSIKCGF